MSINDSLFSSEKHDWRTPAGLWAEWDKEFAFTIDAAASKENAMMHEYWTKEDNALVQDWRGERVWCNPPYGREQRAFIVKAAKLEADVSVLLIPSRTDTAVWHDYIFPMAEIRFLRGRIKFEGAASSAPFPSALVIFWRQNENLDLHEMPGNVYSVAQVHRASA